MTYFDINTIPATVTVAPRRSGKSVAAAAATASLNAAAGALSPSPLDPFAVAYAVGMEAAEHARRDAVARDLATRRETVTLRKPSLLGCWVDGVLKFQSRDHDAIHEYAADKMKPRTRRIGNTLHVITANVWVAPVGSFQA